MSQVVEVDFQKITSTNSTNEKSSYTTVGAYEIIENHKILTYHDNELRDKIVLIYNGKRLKIKTKTTLEFEEGKAVHNNYSTNEGTIRFTTKTQKLEWEKETIFLDYTLYHFDNKIGDFSIKIDLYKKDSKRI